MKILRIAPLAGLIFVAACAADDTNFPSLAPRAIEKARETANDSPAAPAPVDPAFQARIDSLVDQARAGDSAFAAVLAATEQAVSAARGVASGSEKWVVAQQAITALDSARAPTAIALNDLDALLIDLARLQPVATTAAGISAAEAALAIVNPLYEAQNAALNRLKEQISAP